MPKISVVMPAYNAEKTIALNHLGLRVTGPNGVLLPHVTQEVYQVAFGLAPEYDAFQVILEKTIKTEQEERLAYLEEHAINIHHHTIKTN